MAQSSKRVRADILLVARGLFESRSRARAAIEAGLVRAAGVPVAKPSDLLADDVPVEATSPHPWVSRGGVKLAAALDAFAIDPSGRECLDVGASTGGFTDVLLSRGAARVWAVDVGHSQLHPRIAREPRVVPLEGTDARALPGLIAHGTIDLATIDVSFISLHLVIPELMFPLKICAQLVALVKPQFEVGRSGVGRGGIVRDPALLETSVLKVNGLLTELGFAVMGTIPSPIAGGDGNAEFLVGARRG